MMGVHVANSASNKVFFVIDPTGPRDTGAIIYPNGQTSFFNFWGWVSANPEIQKIEENEFQQLLWDEPLPQDEEIWDSFFFSRTAPLSGIIDQNLLVNIGSSGSTDKSAPSKQDVARKIMEKGIGNAKR